MLRQDQEIVILGFGVEGKVLLKYLLEHGFFKITVCDKKETAVDDEWKKLKIDTLKWKHGKDYLKDISKADVIFRSPGFHYQLPEIYDAREKLVTITSSIALFMKNAPGQIIGVTGTKGKGTTASLIYEILKAGGIDVHLGGNIGNSPLEFMDELTAESITVLELSSFQLQDLNTSPHIAVVLNTTVDHLDYHAHMEEYWEAKAMIVRNQTEEDYVVVNQDYQYANYFLGLTKAQPVFVSTRREISALPSHPLAREDDAPEGAFLQKDAIVLRMPNGDLNAICKIEEVGLIGPHNLENILPAVSVGSLIGLDPATIKSAVVKFTGLPHRLELIGEFGGVKYYNDSFSTVPETCIAAINSFKQPIVLMVGGSEKNSDFRALARKIIKTKNLKTIIFMGDHAANRIYDEVEKLNNKATRDAEILESEGREIRNHNILLKMIKTSTFGEAFLAAKMEAEDGNVVLMSPACASFDWFSNYKERGDVFRQMVKDTGA